MGAEKTWCGGVDCVTGAEGYMPMGGAMSVLGRGK